MNDEFVAFEIDENGCGHLKSELPLDPYKAEIKNIKSLPPRGARSAPAPRSEHRRSGIRLRHFADALIPFFQLGLRTERLTGCGPALQRDPASPQLAADASLGNS